VGLYKFCHPRAHHHSLVDGINLLKYIWLCLQDTRVLYNIRFVARHHAVKPGFSARGEIL